MHSTVLLRPVSTMLARWKEESGSIADLQYTCDLRLATVYLLPLPGTILDHTFLWPPNPLLRDSYGSVVMGTAMTKAIGS